MTRAEVKQRRAFADALEKIAEQAASVPCNKWHDYPPDYIAYECRRWARCYRSDGAIRTMKGNHK